MPPTATATKALTSRITATTAKIDRPMPRRLIASHPATKASTSSPAAISPRGKFRTVTMTNTPAATNSTSAMTAATRRDAVIGSHRCDGFPISCCGVLRCGVDGVQRLIDRVVEVVTVERGEQAVPEDEVLQPVAQLDEGQVHSLCVQFAVELLQHVGGADVDVGDRLALQHHPLRTAFEDEVANLLAEHAGIGEEQRCLPPVHEHPASLLGRRRLAQAVPTLAGDVTQYFTMRPPTPLEEEQDGENDGDQNALQHT